MIARVEIENFQSHKRTELEFDPGTNVIIGASDTGKSSIFRALNWVISNRPLGDGFRSEWGGTTRVALHTSENHVIERVRSPNENVYILDGSILAAFGTEVPQDVTNVLQLDSCSIQSQMEAPFLLAASPGEAARLLNKAATIDDIDQVLSGLLKTQVELVRRVRYAEEQCATHRTQLEQYRDIPALEEKVLCLETLSSELSVARARAGTLRDATRRGRLLETQLRKTEHITTLLNQHEKIQCQYTALQADISKYRVLATLARRTREIHDALDRTANLPQVEVVLSAAEQASSIYQEMKKDASTLGAMIRRAASCKTAINTIQARLEQAEEEFHQLSPEICPLCGNQMGAVEV